MPRAYPECPEAMSKYHAKATIVDGRRFDSKAEARRYGDLLLLQRAGEIRDLECQPEYVLVYPFTHQGKKYRGVKYRADFRYRTTTKLVPSETVVEDVKGVRTALYRVKLQMLLTKYPDMNFFEIEA